MQTQEKHLEKKLGCITPKMGAPEGILSFKNNPFD